MSFIGSPVFIGAILVFIFFQLCAVVRLLGEIRGDIYLLRANDSWRIDQEKSRYADDLSREIERHDRYMEKHYQD